MKEVKIVPVSNMELVHSVSAMAEEIWHEHFDKIIGPAQVDYMLDKYLSPDAITGQINSGYEYFLFSTDYTFAGFTCIHEEDGSLFLSKLYVHEDFRGQGIASYVFRKLTELAKLRGLDRIWLTCNRHNTNTLAIYKHLGFRKIREQVTDIGGGFVMDDYVMEYALNK